MVRGTDDGGQAEKYTVAGPPMDGDVVQRARLRLLKRFGISPSSSSSRTEMERLGGDQIFGPFLNSLIYLLYVFHDYMPYRGHAFHSTDMLSIHPDIHQAQVL
jgi:hypothetical protein